MADQTKRKYDATVARIAGNLLSGILVQRVTPNELSANWAEKAAELSVALARKIVAEVERTQPAADLREAAEERSR